MRGDRACVPVDQIREGRRRSVDARSNAGPSVQQTTQRARGETGPDRLAATGTLVVRQTDVGLAPATAVGGSERARNQVEVPVSLVARPPAQTR